MPIYEYLCPTCNRIYSFMATSYEETEKRNPVCPKCGSEEMKKQVSAFSVGHAGTRAKGGDSDAAGEGDQGEDALDDPRVEREMMRLMNEAENIDEDNPRELGRLMRKMSDITGETMDAETEEAVRRLESGEDLW